MTEIIKRTRKPKIGLVVGGGGMKCAYTAGVLTALREHYGLTEPHVVVAESGSAGNAAYYLANQTNHATQTWLSLANNRDLISYRRKKILNIDYLVDHIFRTLHPFDEKALKKTKSELLFPLTNAESGVTEYVSAKPPNDIYEMLRAAKALPFLYDKYVKIGNHFYFDGGIGTTMSDHMRVAVEHGAQTLIVVRVSEGMRGMLKHTLSFTSRYWRKHRGAFYHAFLREIEERSPFVPPNNVRLITISPTKDLKLSILGSSRMRLRAAINLGYDDAVTHPALEELLKRD